MILLILRFAAFVEWHAYHLQYHYANIAGYLCEIITLP